MGSFHSIPSFWYRSCNFIRSMANQHMYVFLYFRKELWLIRVKNVVLSTVAALMFSSQSIATCISIAISFRYDPAFSPFSMLMTLALISTLRATVSTNVAVAVNFLADFFAGLERIQRFLDGDDRGQISHHDGLLKAFALDDACNNDAGRGKSHSQLPTIEKRQKGPRIRNKNSNDPLVASPEEQVVLESVTCSLGYQNLLKSVSLLVSGSDLVLITGPVGCGKSSLLMAILQELPLTHGRISCSGKKVVVPQLPWIFSGTVRENILFGEAMEKERYNLVLESCALTRDIEDFPNGDLTTIGERGVLLSGGQRARVDLARAVYADADVYLLDDPLSAVDANVRLHIFEKCIRGVLGKKTRILVTHSRQFLTKVDKVVIMKEGSILTQGTCAELGDIPDDVVSTSGDVKSAHSRPNQDEQNKETSEDLTGLNIEEEDRSTGSISWAIYWQYFRAGLPCCLVAALILFFIASQGKSQLLWIPPTYNSILQNDQISKLSDAVVWGCGKGLDWMGLVKWAGIEYLGRGG